eukprot:m.94139 g.94139  ORF g.94139 m.94139 type:complete len:539 (-) comp15397_c0_seq9:517-2133(-)
MIRFGDLSAEELDGSASTSTSVVPPQATAHPPAMFRFGDLSADELGGSDSTSVVLPQALAKAAIASSPSPATTDSDAAKATVGAAAPSSSTSTAPSSSTASSSTTTTPVKAPPPASWAALLHKKSAAPSPSPSPSTPQQQEQQLSGEDEAPTDIDAFCKVFVHAWLTTSSSASTAPAPLTSRHCGLTNMGNSCFVNAPLQMLLQTEPIQAMLAAAISAGVLHEAAASWPVPWLRLLCDLSRRMRTSRSQSTPVNMSTVWPRIRDAMPALKARGAKTAQHDAEEFLTFLLAHVHEELAALPKAAANESNGHASASASAHDSDDAWSEVTTKNRTATLRENAVAATPITALLGGTLRSHLHISGSKSSITTQPFFTLPVEIESPSVSTLEDALLQSFQQEELDDVPSSASNKAVRRFCVEDLRRVLILQLKRFQFFGLESMKMTKHVVYPETLVVPLELLEKSRRPLFTNPTSRTYTLTSVCFHHGSTAASGHYTCAGRTSSGWVHFDDDQCWPTDTSDVLRDDRSRQAYLLLYVRKGSQ